MQVKSSVQSISPGSGRYLLADFPRRGVDAFDGGLHKAPLKV